MNTARQENSEHQNPSATVTPRRRRSLLSVLIRPRLITRFGNLLLGTSSQDAEGGHNQENLVDQHSPQLEKAQKPAIRPRRGLQQLNITSPIPEVEDLIDEKSWDVIQHTDCRQSKDANLDADVAKPIKNVAIIGPRIHLLQKEIAESENDNSRNSNIVINHDTSTKSSNSLSTTGVEEEDSKLENYIVSQVTKEEYLQFLNAEVDEYPGQKFNSVTIQDTFKLTSGHIKYASITDDLAKRLTQFNDRFIALFFTSSQPTLKPPRRGPKEKSSWRWNDPAFVRVPLSSKYNKILKTKEIHWKVIEREIKDLKRDVEQGGEDYPVGKRTQEAITRYNGPLAKSDFQVLNNANLQEKLRDTISYIASHALQLPFLLAKPIPILRRDKSKSIYVTKELACSLLANAFLCTFPKERESMPEFNFARLFDGNNATLLEAQVKAEKVKCILNYFSQMRDILTQNVTSSQIISFERRCIREQKDWPASERALIDIYVEPEKGIEHAHDMLQVDFANKIVGGGIFRSDAVMEQLRFCISPELILSRLFTEPLSDDEVLVVTGTEQYSLFTGYSSSFRYGGTSGEMSPKVRDQFGRQLTQVVCMDALYFTTHEKSNQYSKSCIDRELHKWYVAFVHSARANSPVATGNWGCGAFNGDSQLKFFIQWIAASVAGRPALYYHTIGDEEQRGDIEDIVRCLKLRNPTVGLLYGIILDYDGERHQFTSLFDFVKFKISNLF